MVQIERERDPEVLRQVALLLDRENRRLHERLEKLVREIAQLKGADAAPLQLQIDELRELLAQREQTIFGASSEKRPRKEPAPDPEPAPRKGHGPTPQPLLPVVEQLHTLEDDQRTCPTCEGTLEPMGDQAEESEEISVVQRSFVLVKHRRQKYRCRCNAAVVTAPAPPKLVPGGRYSMEFAVEVAVSKYADHLPLERQVEIMLRQGLETSSQSAWDQLNALDRALRPAYEALHPRILESPVVHADETRWQLMTRKGSSRWWVWSVASRDAVFYRISSTRSAKAARPLLSGYRGVVMCDGYAAYKTLARAGPGFDLAHCWAHARRKFIEAESGYAEACKPLLEWIGKLFAIEREAPFSQMPECPETLELRRRLRDEHSRPLVREILTEARRIEKTVLSRSSLGKAVAYLLAHWQGLTRFLEDPRVPLDNNLAERQLRRVVLGRKNHYGSRSRRGTEVAALFYSLIDTAKLLGVEPRHYLLQATRAALHTPGTVLLPHDLITN